MEKFLERPEIICMNLIFSNIFGKLYVSGEAQSFPNNMLRISLLAWQPFEDLEKILYIFQFIDIFVKTECNAQIKSYFLRVPSYSNPIDGMSKLLCNPYLSLGAKPTTIEWERLCFLVDELRSDVGGSEDAAIIGKKGKSAINPIN